MTSGTPQLRLYDTLTREKRAFAPLDPDNVRVYVCGPTVYDYAHIGNARPVIVFDLLFRLLRHVYGPEHVTYVRNITDVDDKINARAARDYPGLPLNEAIRKVTEKTANQFEADAKALGCLTPTVEPRATENIDEMIALIGALIQKGHAYEAGGEVLFSVPSMPDYGQLSGRDLENNVAGARVAVEAHKHNPADFILWKLSSEDEPGWESPWGRGRPGWHIECSAMSERYLSQVFDIHGGGLDLIFPHHENEIAQSRCAHGTEQMAQFWMHNGFLQVEGQKMSKSLGNFVTIHDLLETEKFGGRKWPGEVLRLAMLMTHYREPIDFSVKRLEEALAIWRSFAAIVRDFTYEPTVDEAVLASLSDDLNSPLAIQNLVQLRNAAAHGDITAGRRLLGSLRLLGFFEQPFGLKLTIHYPNTEPSQFTVDEFVGANTRLASDVPVSVVSNHVSRGRSADHIVVPLNMFAESTMWSDVIHLHERNVSIERLNAGTSARLAALANKDFTTADGIRAELAEQGIALLDYKDPETGERRTKWEVKR